MVFFCLGACRSGGTMPRPSKATSLGPYILLETIGHGSFGKYVDGVGCGAVVRGGMGGCVWWRLCE